MIAFLAPLALTLLSATVTAPEALMRPAKMFADVDAPEC